MPGHDVIVIGGSAGSVEALLRLVPHLPRDLDAAVLLTLHLPPDSPSNLPRILSTRGPLAAKAAQDGEPPRRGVIHVARPDRHLVLVDGRMQLSRGPRENGHRPAIDALFRSAARARGASVVAVVLSGALDDGTAGLHVVRRNGGIAVVQDPKDALYSSMPRSAIREVGADHVVRAADMGPLLARLAALPVGESRPRRRSSARRGSPFSCPDCGGVLDFMPGGPLRLKCQVGHRWTARSLAEGKSDQLEGALWAAYRALVEHVRLYDAMAERARERGNYKSAARYADRSLESHERARLVREALGLGDDEAERPPTPAEHDAVHDAVEEAEAEAPRGAEARDVDGNGAPKG